MRWRSHILLGLAVAFIAIAPALFGTFTITLMNYIGIYAFAALGLVLLTGVGGLTSFGQAAFVGIGAYATAWYTAVQGGSPWIGLLLALVLSGLAAHDPGRSNAAAQRTLPAAQHHRLGHRHLFRIRQSRCAQPLQRAVRHSADLDRTGLARRHHRHLFLHLDSARRRHAALPQPARFTARPRHPQPARRHCHGGKPRDRQLPHAAGDLRSRRRARRPFRLALCAHAKVRESDAVRHSPRHRASVHGAGRRRRTDRRRRGRRRDRRPAQERVAGRASRRHPLQRAARSGVVRRAAGHHPAEGARRHRADGPPLSAAA